MAYLDAKVVMKPGAAARLDRRIAGLEAALQELGTIIAQRAQSWAQRSRTWTDRTSHARQTLTGRAVMEAGRLVIYLFHGAAYGIWLELANGGRYAVIMRTLQTMYPQLMRMAARLVGGG